jgi:1-deoxy-D-xylulose-5-phosphate reductoisomerase
MISTNPASRSVTILGSTGSIGRNTVYILQNIQENFRINAITANRNITLLAQQAIELNAELAVTADESLYGELTQLLSGTDIKVAAGKQAVVDAASIAVDWTMSAIVGTAGFLPTLAAIKNGKIVAIANKETFVCGGAYVNSEIKKHGATIIPVDSEHSAIFQVFNESQRESISKIILTASGGPFRNFTTKQMQNITKQQALTHPNWDMGNKITIDSATMMNKGLELIEAYHLFNIPQEQIEIIVHPESIIHSMVEYHDGSVLAQLGTSDMCTPIAYALGYPKRVKVDRPKLNLAVTAQLNFQVPDLDKFPALELARSALAIGGMTPNILNAANEVAVAAFLADKITYHDIIKIVDKCLHKLSYNLPMTQENIIEVDNDVRGVAAQLA